MSVIRLNVRSAFPGCCQLCVTVSACDNPVEARLLKCMRDCQVLGVCVCVCVDRAGGWALCLAD